MAKKIVWQDDFWLPLMELYLKRPIGVKATYSREMVGLSMELHVEPPVLAERMEQIAKLSTPRLEHIWETYSDNPRRLKRAVSLWRQMRGFGFADSFYDGVGVEESFESDFRPIAEDERLTPVALIIMLSLYFQLTPQTMVVETPEVQEIAHLLGVDAALVVYVLQTYQICDPYFVHRNSSTSLLLKPCQNIWRRYGNGDIEQLTAFAEELKAYYK
jgi:hypothetical protein